jgi:chaperonin GroES
MNSRREISHLGHSAGIFFALSSSKDKHFQIISGRIIRMKIKPLNDRVLVLRIEQEEKTSGGIIIPDTAKEKPQEGKVIAVGPGKVNDKGERIPLEVKEKDRVLFGKYSGSEIKVDGVEHLIMREDDILAIVQ